MHDAQVAVRSGSQCSLQLLQAAVAKCYTADDVERVHAWNLCTN